MFEALTPSVQHHIVNSLRWPSLRPLQEEAIPSVLAGHDSLLLAPTAGGKTEAAIFPLLTKMADESWQGLSVLYVCPLKALLNNLAPRVNSYAQWIGRRAEVRHGDTTASVRRRQALAPPDILLTTPETLESMLISRSVDHERVFGGVKAIVIDEVHAFAGDERGWHLLSVLERVTEVAGGPIQRIGLSATVGNAPQLLEWLQGSNRDAERESRVVVPGAFGADPGSDSHFPVDRSDPDPATQADLELDYVGSLENAAKIISALHRGEKRLVFADSRRSVEALSSRYER